MALARVKNLAKLTLLIGTPIAILVGMFSCGVYCGHENRDAVLKFERDWLGFDVTVPGEPVPVKTEPVKTEPVKTEPVKTEPMPVKTEPVKTEPTPVKTEPVPVQPEPVVLAKVEDPLPFPMPEPAPLSGDSRAKLDDPVRISVKVLVDPALAVRRPDWLAYVQRHIAWGSLVLEKQIGLHLDLAGIVKLVDTPRDLTEVQSHAREGANLLLVFVDDEFSRPVAVNGFNNANLDVMVVHAVGRSRSAHLRGLLLAVGQVLGAQPLGPDDEATVQGSWMGAVRVEDTRPIKLDATNRLIMLTHKAYDFTSPSLAGQPSEPTPPDEPTPAQPTLPTVHDEPALPEEEAP